MARLGVTPASAAANRLTFGTVGGAYLETIKKIYVEEPGFAKAHDVDIVWDVQQGSTLLAKLMSSCGAPIYDTLQASPDYAAKASVSGCIQPYDPKVVTNLADIEPAYVFRDYFVASLRLLNGLVYNTRHVKQPPQSWEALADPAYKGKVGIPAYGWIGNRLIYAINKAQGGTEDNIDPGIKALAQIVRKNDAVIVQHANSADLMFQREEIWIMPHWTGRYLNLKKQGVPVAIYYPQDFLYTDIGYVVPKGAKSAELAQQLINVTLDPAVQARMLELLQYAPTNRKVKIPPAFADAVLPDYAKSRALDVDWAKLVNYSDRDLERWNKEVLGR
jgi:spermidine/putrescine-binding protein